MEWLPSLFAAHPLNLKEGLDLIVNANIQQVHLDCMDGHFVPNITFGPGVIKAVKQYTPHLFRDVHLMLSHPENFIESYIANGAQRVYVHLEIDSNSLNKSIEILKKSKCLWGFAINPETPISLLKVYLHEVEQIDRLLVMSVHPGFSGQTFIPETYDRIQEIRQLFPKLDLCVDGGITPNIAENLSQLGVSSCVRGSNFFKV